MFFPQDSWKFEKRSLLKEILYNDFYWLRRIKDSKERVNIFIDIGANVGIFGVISRCLFPDSFYYGFEPNEKTFNCLYNNLLGFRDINLFNKALGNGDTFNFKTIKKNTCGGNFLYKDENNFKNNIKTYTLNELLTNIDYKNSYLKIDCEGGEEFLVNDELSEEIILSSKYCCMEIHCYDPHDIEFDHFKPYSYYISWLEKIKKYKKIEFIVDKPKLKTIFIG